MVRLKSDVPPKNSEENHRYYNNPEYQKKRQFIKMMPNVFHGAPPKLKRLI